jgi:hypothetical protein
MSNRKKEYPFEATMPKINRPLAFPELARGRTFARPFNIKVEPLRPRRQGIESYNRAQMALLGLGVFAAVSAALIALRVAVFLPTLE